MAEHKDSSSLFIAYLESDMLSIFDDGNTIHTKSNQPDCKGKATHGITRAEFNQAINNKKISQQNNNDELLTPQIRLCEKCVAAWPIGTYNQKTGESKYTCSIEMLYGDWVELQIQRWNRVTNVFKPDIFDIYAIPIKAKIGIQNLVKKIKFPGQWQLDVTTLPHGGVTTYTTRNITGYTLTNNQNSRYRLMPRKINVVVKPKPQQHQQSKITTTTNNDDCCRNCDPERNDCCKLLCCLLLCVGKIAGR